MPAEVFDEEKFITLSAKAEVCYVKRAKEHVKLKLRTPKKLFTLKVTPGKAEELMKKLQCKTEEV
jgi:hypothetical protein